jgi:hypothetical protein
MFIPWYILRSSMVVVVDDGGGMCGPISLRFVLRESKVLLLLLVLVYEFCDESELYDSTGEGMMFVVDDVGGGACGGS